MKTTTLVKWYIKIRKEHPDNYYNLLNLFVFPALTFINILVTTYFFSKQIPMDFSINDALLNKILVYTFCILLWQVIPIIGLIKKPFNVYRSNTMFFGSLVLYTVLTSNLLMFYVGFFFIASRNTSFGQKIKEKIKKSDTLPLFFYTIFPMINKD
jgi:hypothetical protein